MSGLVTHIGTRYSGVFCLPPQQEVVPVFLQVFVFKLKWDVNTEMIVKSDKHLPQEPFFSQFSRIYSSFM